MSKREIKFRAWDNREKRYVSSSMVQNQVILTEPTEHGFKLKTCFILEQFTGLLDKQGKEIYEGDIIKYPNEIYRMFRAVGWEGEIDGFELVVWSEKNIAFMGKDLNRLQEGYQLEEISPRYLWVLEMAKKSEVFGNIHQNPELLEIANGN